MNKAPDQGMIGDDKDFFKEGLRMREWKDTEFERQVRSQRLIPRGDAIHAHARMQWSATVARRRELSSSTREFEVDKHPRKS